MNFCPCARFETTDAAPVYDQIDHYIDAVLFHLMHEFDEIAARSMARINAIVIADVVAVVLVGRRLKRRQPDRADAERMQIFETPRQSLEITDAIAVGVHEGFQIQAIDDRVFVPKIFDHRRTAKRNRSPIYRKRIDLEFRSTTGQLETVNRV